MKPSRISGMMRGGFLFLVCVGLVGVGFGEVKEFEFPLMGTKFAVRGEGVTEVEAKELFELGKKINSACSDYDQTSELMKLNRWPAGKAFELSPILYEVLEKALVIAERTDGAYDPTVGWHTWNWRKSRRNGELPSEAAIAKAKAASGWRKLVLNKETRSVTKMVAGMRIDLGGIAKGYAADRMYAVLKEKGLLQCSVAAGGDLRLGAAPVESGWDVELKTLDEEGELVPKRIRLTKCGVSTSGDLHQWIEVGGERYSHIVDVKTGLGLKRRVSATVFAGSATLTDALGTALCVAPERARDLRKVMREEHGVGFEYLVVIEGEDGEKRVEKSDLFQSLVE